MIENVFYSSQGTVNQLFILYREKLKNYQEKINQKQELTKWEVLDYLVSLHFCLEFKVNDFFREHSLFRYHHDFNEPKKLVDWMTRYFNKISLADKISAFFYFNPILKNDSFEFIMIVKKVRDFSWVRNYILHWNELDTIHKHERLFRDPDSEPMTLSESSVKSFTIYDCEKQKALYEDIIKLFKECCLGTKLWLEHEKLINNKLQSIFD